MISNIVQYEWQNYQNIASSQYQQWLQQQNINNPNPSPDFLLQLQQQRENFINSLPREIAQAVVNKGLPSEWYQYREVTHNMD